MVKSKPALHSTSEEPWESFLAISSYTKHTQRYPVSITRTCDLDLNDVFKSDIINSRPVEEDS